MGLLIFCTHPAVAAERCPVKIESVDEDRALAETRPIWTASLFSVTLLAKDIVPSEVSLRAYTLGHVFHGQASDVHWFPTATSSVYRSSPIVLAFPSDETFLHVGVTSLKDMNGYRDCVQRVRTAYASLPSLSLAPLNPQGSVAMKADAQPVPRPVHQQACNQSDTPIRLAEHVPLQVRAPDDAPVNGGPYVALIGVHVSRLGKVTKSYIEASSGLPWFDAQVNESARQQTYTPATFACRPVPGTYYFAGQFDTANESDLTHAF